MRRRVDQIAAQLADILEQRAVAGDDIVPELARRKFLGDDDRAAAHQERADRRHAADRVIHRQAIIHAVVRRRVHQAGKPKAPLHQPAMADVGGFRHSGGAGRVNRERPIGDRHRAALGLRERSPREAFDLAVDARQFAAAVPPDFRPGRERLRERNCVASSAATITCFGFDDIEAMRQRRSAQAAY